MADSPELLCRHRDLQEVLKFWRQFGYYDYPIDDQRKLVEGHLYYNTLEIVRDNGNIVALGRFNVNGDTAHVIDCIIHPDYRRQNLLKVMLVKGLRKFPHVKYITYKRGLKGKGYRTFNIYTFLGIKENK